MKSLSCLENLKFFWLIFKVEKYRQLVDFNTYSTKTWKETQEFTGKKHQIIQGVTKEYLKKDIERNILKLQ